MYGSGRYRLREPSDVRICIYYIQANLVGQHPRLLLQIPNLLPAETVAMSFRNLKTTQGITVYQIP